MVVALVAVADMELAAVVVELVELVADVTVTVLVFIRVLAAGLAAKNRQG